MTSKLQTVYAMSHVLYIDWDETITQKDTLSLLAPTAEEVKEGPTFDYYQNEYVRGHEHFVQHFGEMKTKEDLLRFVKDVKQSESESISKVIQGGLFAGTTHAQRFQRLRLLQYRDGWADMARYITERARSGMLEAYIVSVNWSKSFIAEGLRQASHNTKLAGLYEPGFSEIYSNELEEDAETTICTGRIVGPLQAEPIVSGFDKLAICQKIAATKPDSVHIYIGDSLTDWPCLLWADVGILMGSNSSLLNKLRTTNWHTSLCPVKVWLTLDWNEKRSSVVQAKNWSEVQDLLQSLPPSKWGP